MYWWKHEVEIIAISCVWFTVLKAFNRSIAIATLRRGGGRGSLKPVAILCVSGNRAEVVDPCFRKPRWMSDKFRCRLRYGRSNRRYEVQRLWSLPTLGYGIILACFHIEGISALCIYRLKSLVRCWLPRGNMWFRWNIVSSSGPTAVELLDSLMTFTKSSAVKGEKS